MGKQQIGVIGLAVMGKNLALNIESRGYSVSVYNRSREKTDAMMANEAKGKNVVPAYSIEEFVNSLETPRRIIIMVKAGAPVDAQIKAVSVQGRHFNRRRQLVLPGHHPPQQGAGGGGLSLHRHRRVGRRGRRAQGPSDHAGRAEGRL